MMKQQEQQRLQQQQLLQLFMTKMGRVDSRPISPMMGIQGMMVPNMVSMVGGIRPGD